MRSGTMAPRSGIGASVGVLLPLSLVLNLVLVLLFGLQSFPPPEGDPRLDVESALLARQPSAALDLHRITGHLERVNNQMEENVAVLKGARISLEESLVLEEMRGLPPAEVKKVLKRVRDSQAALLPNETAGGPSSSAAAAGGGAGGGQKEGAAASGSGNGTASGAAISGSGKKWLTIGIPTVPRSGGSDYLTRTVETLLDELPLEETDPLYGKVLVVVMNMEKGNHTAFYSLKSRLEHEVLGDHYSKKAAIYLRLLESPFAFKDPTPDAPEPDSSNNPHDLPGRVARKQSSDVLGLLQATEDLGHFFMFMEDDFETCPHSIYHLQYALRKLNAVQEGRGWLALRASYGMNGIVLRNEDKSRFAKFAHEHVGRKPIDLLWQEFALHNTEHTAVLTRGRDQYIYRFNLFTHIGEVSSFPDRPIRGKWPQCYDLMTRAWSLQDNEKFDKRCLDSSDFTPCQPSARQLPTQAKKGEAPPRWARARLNRPDMLPK